MFAKEKEKFLGKGIIPGGSCRCGNKSTRGSFVPSANTIVHELTKFVKQHKEEFLIPFSRRLLLRDARQIRSFAGLQSASEPLPRVGCNNLSHLYSTCRNCKHLFYLVVYVNQYLLCKKFPCFEVKEDEISRQEVSVQCSILSKVRM